MARREMSPVSFLAFLLLLLLSGLAAADGVDGGNTPPGGSTSSLFLLTGYKPPPSLPRPPHNRGPAKEAEVHGEEENGIDKPAPLGAAVAGAEMPPKPLPQRGSNVSAADALKPPLGAAKVAPAPRQLVDTDSCRGYFDVMGQFDSPFNCSKDTYIYCCGTCHYRFCCEHQRNRLDQASCNNYISPVWANTQITPTVGTGNRPDPDFETLLQQSSSTTYVIGGVISFTLVMAVGVRIAFSKVSRRPRNRDINMPRALVDILRHQSSPVQPGGVRNSSTILTTSSSSATAADGRAGSKNLYASSAMQSKDNRSIGIGNLQHPFKQQGAGGSSPKHSATIERPPPRIMNNSQLPVAGGSLALGGGGGGGGTLPNSKHSNNMFTSTSFSSSLSRPVPPHGAHHSHIYHQGQRQPSSHSFSHSFHNLAQLPPSYESAVKPDISRYCSLKRLEKELDDYSGYYSSSGSKRRNNNNAPPSFHSSQHHLQYGGGGGGGDYTLGSARGTLPLHGSRPRLHLASTPNPYPLPPQQQQQQQQQQPYSAFDRPPRRVRSQDELLAFGEGNTLSRLQAKSQQQQQHQQYYNKAGMSTSKTAQTLRRSQERLLVSPDRLEERLVAMGLLVGAGGDRRVSGGGVPTMGRLSHNHKAQSQQNICATTPSLDRHHMIKMNSHPTSGHEHEQSTPPSRGGGGGWDHHGSGRGHMGGGGGGGGGGGHPNARRMAFATKRQNTIEQLHFIPGGGGERGGGGGGGQGLRTGSKNEVTV